jgi:predicted porin
MITHGVKLVRNLDLKTASGSEASTDRYRSGFAVRGFGFLPVMLLSLAAAGIAQAQSISIPPAAPTDDSLTWHGITLYGIVDVGLQYDNHMAPISDYYPAGSGAVVQKNSNGSVTGITPSNLSQSRVGLQGKEALPFMDWSAVFKLETFFNPQSGNISDGLKSLVQNNNKPLASQSTNIDSSVAGQAFQQSFAGFSSPTFGTFTFGRQNTLYADGISKYDPMSASQAFSVIGLSGTPAGGGATQDRRLDDSLKYTVNYKGVHVGLMYKFSNGNAEAFRNGGGSGEAYTVLQAQLGFNYKGASVDGYYLKTKDAISASAISTKQCGNSAALPGACPLLPAGFSLSNSVSGTVADTETWAILTSYDFGGPKVYAGYEHVTYSDPSIPLPAGYNDIGGYVLAFVNNTPYAAADKVLQVYWTGVKYPVSQNLDLIAAFYGYKQDSYATGKYAGCTNNVSPACSGNLWAYSIAAVYRLTKHFDAYGGAMYSGVKNGLANGYLNTSNIDPTVGVRYSF